MKIKESQLRKIISETIRTSLKESLFQKTATMKPQIENNLEIWLEYVQEAIKTKDYGSLMLYCLKMVETLKAEGYEYKVDTDI